LAICFSQNNYIVGIAARRENSLLEVQALNSSAIHIAAFDCNLDHKNASLEKLVVTLGGLDLLVFCSGTGDINESLNFEIEKSTIDLNVSAFTRVADWAYTFFENQTHGHFVGISSIAGYRGGRLAPAYNASKAYQINYMEGLRSKAFHSKKDIIITDIRPGFVDTPMAKGEGLFWVASPEKAAAQIYQHIKNKRSIAYVTKRWFLIAILFKILPSFLYKRM